jgi:hypothetical protein
MGYKMTRNKTNKLRMARAVNGKTFTKRTVLFSAVALLSTSAMAAEMSYPTHKFGLIMRGDLAQTNSDSNTGKKATKNFSVGNVRINLTGKLDENTDYRVRYRMSKESTGTKTNTDHLTSSTDYAYITHKLDVDTKVRLGKFFATGVGGREGNYGGQDVYQYSLVGDNTLAYETGVGVYRDIGSQTFMVSVFNASNKKSDNQNSLGGAVTWYGNLNDGMVKPIVSYAYKSGVNGMDKNQYYGIGARITPISGNMMYIEPDFLGIKMGNAKGNSNDDQTMTSAILNAHMFAMDGKVQPIAKVFFDRSKQDSNVMNQYKRRGVSLAMEYHPNFGKSNAVDWRVHVAFNLVHKEFDNANTGPNTNDKTVLTGFDFAF